MTKRIHIIVAGLATLGGCQGTIAGVGDDPPAETMVDDLGNALSPVSRAIVEANSENSQPLARVQTGPGQLLELYEGAAGRTMISGTGGLTPEVLELSRQSNVTVDQFLKVASQIVQDAAQPDPAAGGASERPDGEVGVQQLALQEAVPQPGEPGYCDSGTFTPPGRGRFAFNVHSCPDDPFTRCFPDTTGRHRARRNNVSGYYMVVCSKSGPTNTLFYLEDTWNSEATIIENTARFALGHDPCRDSNSIPGLLADCPDAVLEANSAGTYDFWFGADRSSL
jgi:hypothetical protein